MEIRIKTRRCTKCNVRKLLTKEYFYKGRNYKYGFAYYCKECNKKQYLENRNKYTKNRRDNYWADPVTARSRVQAYRNRGNNRKQLNKRRRLKRSFRTQEQLIIDREERLNWYYKHKKEIIFQKKIKRRNNINIRLKDNLRRRINEAIKKGYKSTHTMQLIGCSINFLKQYLEAKFQSGMSWNNHGEWHIDHIKPCSSFNLISPNEQRKCFHYTNLQPLWARDNIKKGTKLVA